MAAVQPEAVRRTRQLESDRLCILGPVALRVDGKEHPLSGMPARIVTLLALTPDRPLPLEALIDQSWAGRPPESGRAAIHVHLGAVRRWLAQHAPTSGIDQSTAGYRLALGDLHLDSTLMIDLAERGHSTVVDAPRDAIELLRSALALYRGPLSSPAWWPDAVDAASQRLERCRLGVEEDLVEALLVVGSFAAAEAMAVRHRQHRRRRQGRGHLRRRPDSDTHQDPRQIEANVQPLHDRIADLESQLEILRPPTG